MTTDLTAGALRRHVRLFVVGDGSEAYEFDINRDLGLSGDPLPGLNGMRGLWIASGEPIGALAAEAEVVKDARRVERHPQPPSRVSYAAATDGRGWIIHAAVIR